MTAPFARPPSDVYLGTCKWIERNKVSGKKMVLRVGASGRPFLLFFAWLLQTEHTVLRMFSANTSCLSQASDEYVWEIFLSYFPFEGQWDVERYVVCKQTPIKIASPCVDVCASPFQLTCCFLSPCLEMICVCGRRSCLLLSSCRVVILASCYGNC